MAGKINIKMCGNAATGPPGVFATPPPGCEPAGTMCLGCGKDPYLSSTGCICPLGGGQWVPGKGSYGRSIPLRSDDDGGDVICLCGAVRARASKAPGRLLPCRQCGDEPGEAKEVIARRDKLEKEPLPDF